MPDDPKKSDQFDGDADAIKGGGATTDRGRRDAGMPGPAPDAAERERGRGLAENPRDRDPDRR